MPLVLSTSGAPLFLPFSCQPFSGQHYTNSLSHLESTFSSNRLIGSWESQETREWEKTYFPAIENYLIINVANI